jgi:hypothetical protein
MPTVAVLSVGNTAHGIVDLIILLGLLFLDFFAVTQIITKAGYSSKWILLPLTPVVLGVISLILLAVDVRTETFGGITVTQPVNLSDFAALQVLDLISVITTWVFFLIFAFSNWPVLAQRTPIRGIAAGWRPEVSPPISPPAVPLAPTGSMAPALSPDHADAQPPVDTGVIYCSWCGKARAADALAIHHCGPVDRPASFCMRCGTPLETGAPACASCGTSAADLSR